MKFLFLPPQSDLTRRWAAALQQEFGTAKMIVAETEAAAAEQIENADAVYGRVSPALLNAARQLRWVQSPLAGPPPGYYFPEIIAHPAVITNMRGVYNEHVAVHAVALVLAHARRLNRYIPQQLEHRWERLPAHENSVVLEGRSVLILGLGGIGRRIATLSAAFGMKVTGVDLDPSTIDGFEGPVYPRDRLISLLPDSDIVYVTVPGTEANIGLCDNAFFAAMKRSGFFVNVGRGATTRLDDLDSALRAGTIGGAALDVAEIEPLPRDHPIWDAPNIIITPHAAGFGPDQDGKRFELLRENLRAFIADRPLQNVIDKARGY